MLKNKPGLEVQKSNRSYQFHYDEDAPIGEIYDALCILKFHVASIIEKDSKNDSPPPKEGEKE